MARALVIAAALAAPALGFAPAPSALPRASCRSAPALSMRLGGGSGFGFRKGGVVRGKSWTKGIVPRVPGGGNAGGVSGGGGNGVARNAGEGAAEEPEPKAEEALGVWAAYEAALEKDPLLIKGLTSMIGFFLGDVLAQCFIEKSDKYDIWRTIRFSSFGLLVHGTTSHWFYGKLDGKIPGTGAGAVASKVGIDQVLWNPIFGIMFFGYMGIFEGSGVGGTITKIKKDLLTQVTGSWTVWPIAHAINFKFIPNSQRVLYINTIQIFYNCFLSIIGSRTPETA